MGYIYVSEMHEGERIWAVGFYEAPDSFYCESAYSSKHAAIDRVRWLNGADVGSDTVRSWERTKIDYVAEAYEP